MNLCPVPRGRSNFNYSPSGMTEKKNKQTPLAGPTDEARGKALGQRDNEELSILCSDSARAQPGQLGWTGRVPVPSPEHRDPRGILAGPAGMGYK